MTIRIVLADDQGGLFRSTLRLLVDTEPDLEVVAEATNGGEAVRAARRFHPDVVVADLQMPGIDGIAATRSITSDPLLRGTRVMVLTTFEYDDNVAAALRAGASGFIGKDASPAGTAGRDTRSGAGGDTLMSPGSHPDAGESLPVPTVGRSGRGVGGRRDADPPAGTRGRGAGGRGIRQRRDRRPPADQCADRENPCEQGDDEVRCARPVAARRGRV